MVVWSQKAINYALWASEVGVYGYIISCRGDLSAPVIQPMLINQSVASSGKGRPYELM